MSEERAEHQTAAVAIRNDGAMSLKQIGDRVNLVHQVLEKVLKKGTHYGTVPGCGDKMVLLKPGADVLAMTFRLVPQFAVTRTDLEQGHREYDVTCSMYGADGALLGQGVGSASTMEKKYRYRKGARGERIENEDIADTYNTVLKIAKKRAHIDATLTVTGSADLFTQDLIDDDEPQRAPVSMPTARPAARPATEAKPREPIVATGEGTSGIVEAVSEKKGTKNGREWVRYGIKIADAWYNTFSESDVETARNSKDLAVPVLITYTTNQKGFHDVLAIEPDIEQTQPAAACEEAEPAADPF